MEAVIKILGGSSSGVMMMEWWSSEGNHFVPFLLSLQNRINADSLNTGERSGVIDVGHGGLYSVFRYHYSKVEVEIIACVHACAVCMHARVCVRVSPPRV